MPAIDAAGFAVGAILLVAARLVPQLISPLAFWLLIAALAAGFGIDLLHWLARGVHAIILDGDLLILRRGRHSAIQRIDRASVETVTSRRGWGGQAIEVRLRGPGGRGRVLLRDDAFDRAEFALLAERLTAWER
jgi:hypothetical protein